MRKLDLMEFYAYIVAFYRENGVTPGTAVLANRFKLHPKTIRENMNILKMQGKIKYEETGKYNTKYSLK